MMIPGTRLTLNAEARTARRASASWSGGVLVREGRLQELIAIENQTELVIAGASDDLVQEIESLMSRSNAKLIERRKSTTTLERLFLESTGGNDKSSTRE